MVIPSSFSRIFFSLTLAFSFQGASAFATGLHDQAIESARAGRYDSALPVLERLVRENPRRTVYLHDLIAVLSWAERHVEALATSQSLVLDARVPDYVLAAIGKSALSTGQTERARQAYGLLSSRRPLDADAARGLAMAMRMGGNTHQPVSVEPVSTKTPSTGLAVMPVSQPSQIQFLNQKQNLNGQRIREAQVLLDNSFTPERYRLIDAALAENAVLISQAKAGNDTDVLRRLQGDRVVALQARGMNPQAIEEFRALETHAGPAPAYVVAAAAGASLSQRLPEQAIELYQRAIKNDPDNSGLKTGLMYAELEAEHFANAQLIVEERLTNTANSPAAQRNQATFLRLADRIEQSQAVLQKLANELPNDAGIWLEQGDAFAQRGLPRAAAERYQAVLALEPGSIKARVGLANALWAQGAIVDTGILINTLKAEAPEHPAVQRLLKAWQRNARPLLTSSITRGFGQGQVTGNNDLVWESTLFSGMTVNGLRIFANHHKADASFNGQSANHERVGAGVEWTQRGVQATFELGRDLHNAQDAAWAASAAWQLDDQFSMRVRRESQTNDLPLKARQPDAESYLGATTYLHADKTLVGAAYRWNESRRAAVDVASYNFNDGNHRQSLSASWFERLYSGYGRTLDLLGAAYTSNNSLRDTIYFNPKRDVAWSATLTGDWLTWRRYERSFNQRLALTLGNYQQTSDIFQDGAWISQRYGWNAFQDIRYEHEWQWGPDVSTRYGIGVQRFPYDGIYETKHYVYAHVNWRF
jgi:poly-beta-1,6 N-acetyl-D-glucosamine export porin PgaA